jgi:NAD+ synthase (glutamine-hydrolysing)
MEKEKFKTALYQFNSLLGNFEENSKKIIKAIEKAKEENVQLLVVPELAISGYPTGDFIYHPDFIKKEKAALNAIVKHVDTSMAVIIGTFSEAAPKAGGRAFYNEAVFISNQKILFRQQKSLLANDDVFYDPRYFQPAESTDIFEWQGIRFGLLICEDIWQEKLGGEKSPAKILLDKGADILITLNASPYYHHKQDHRLELGKTISAYQDTPFLYVNRVGIQTDLIYDGGSYFIDSGKNIIQAPFHEEAFLTGRPFAAVNNSASAEAPHIGKYEELFHALRYGLKNFVHISGFKKVHLGLSGGIDSALVATLAVYALGEENVRAFLMPSRYSSQSSLDDSLALAENLQIEASVLPIEATHKVFEQTLLPFFSLQGLTDENLQARIRGIYLMAFGNEHKSLLLTTSNKSELATGYGTLYGDMCGAVNIIGDLYKTEVYKLCHHINKRGGQPVIPENILTKAPSAELRPNQKDQDSLPPYEILDAILKAVIEHNISRDDLINKEGYDNKTVDKILRLLAANEFKRYQSPPILKVSQKAFGSGRIAPLNRTFFEL